MSAAARRAFLVNVASLRRRPGTVSVTHRRGPIEGLEMPGSAVPLGAEVDVEAKLEAVPGGVMVAATVSAPWVGECRRCLDPASGVAVQEVRELYAEGDDVDVETAYPLVGEQLDLAPLARDAVLLDLPQVPLCRSDCAGLCPTCGENRNDGPCGCDGAELDPRWAALDVLRDRPPA